jgi:uncharacterized DUF497 family protein
MRFNWDPRKAESNVRKHRVSFDEAVTVFDDPLVVVEGQDHARESRLVAIGYSARVRMLLVIVTEVHHEEIRIVSARRAEKHERKAYEERPR